MIIVELLKSMRPKQWTKNLLLFAGLIFDKKFTNPNLTLRAFLGFILFCLISGAIYIINDIKDIEEDKFHPIKKKRPIASGKISIPTALTFSITIIILSLISAYLLNVGFGNSALVYVILILLYSGFLKHIVILDIMIVSIGFVIRAIAGAQVIGIIFSPWLLICTMFLALFLALCKRRYELVVLSDNANIHRKVLEEYSPLFLDQMISIVTASTVISYALYTITRWEEKRLIYTIPFVLYGIFRYLYLVYKKGEGGSPEILLLKDKSLLLDILLWVAVSIFILIKWF